MYNLISPSNLAAVDEITKFATFFPYLPFAVKEQTVYCEASAKAISLYLSNAVGEA